MKPRNSGVGVQVSQQPRGATRWAIWGPSVVVALASWVWVLCHLDPGGSYPSLPAGPGLTIDETFNVQQGVILVEALRAYGVGIVLPEAVQDVFSPPLHLPDHPPLGRFWLGLHHHLVWALAPPQSPEGLFVTACARAGSATALALLILLLGVYAAHWYGPLAGGLTAASVWLVPRLIGHAHLAALETCTNLTCTAAVLAVAAGWTRTPTAPSSRMVVATGVVFGLALLTKIQAILLPVPIVLWAFWHWRNAAWRPLLLWGATGCVVFFLGWPWLWLDPVGHLGQYLKGAADRVELSVWFLGHRYTDRSVPLAYVPVTVLATLPVWLLVLGGIGSRRGSADSSTPQQVGDQLILWSAVWPILLFTLPQVPVYDSERLWLFAVPLWLLVAGRGTALVLERLARRWPTRRQVVAGVVIGLVAVQIVWLNRGAPIYLSANSGAVGGMRGAAGLDLERNYWGDAITRPLLEAVVRELPRNQTIALVPVLHQFQAEELWRQSPLLRQHGTRVIAYDPEQPPPDYLLLYQRRADLPADLRQPTDIWEPVWEQAQSGVVLSGLYRRRPEQP